MTLDEECALSYYSPIGRLGGRGGAELVRRTDDGRVFVKKILTDCDKRVYDYIARTHPEGVPYIYELVEDDDKLIVIEEYVGGRPLSDVLAERGRLGRDEAFEIVRRLCAILSPLHGADPPIIHRDVKPDNIIVSGSGGVTLLDFDAANISRSDKTRDTRLMGTVGYAAPEQYGFGASDVRTDVYSLGVLLNVMLTGAFPDETLARGDAGAIIKKCTAVKPSDRYDGVDNLFRALSGRSAFRRSALPPGMRSVKTPGAFFAALGYAALAVFSFTIDVEALEYSPLWLNRLTVFMLFLCPILFSGNWLGVLDLLRITRIRSRFLRVLLIIAGDLTILVLIIVILSLVENGLRSGL